MKPGVHATRLAVAKPLYSQVRDVLLRRIGQGEWSAGDSLPNEFLLSSDFGVSIGTIRRAIEGLEQTGVLKRIQGRGTYVAGPGAMALEDKFCRLRIAGSAAAEITHELDGIARRRVDADEARALHIGSNDDITAIRQRVIVASTVVGIEVSTVSAARFPRLETQLPYGQLVYRALAEYGTLVSHASEAIGSGAASPEVAALLGCAPGHPLLEVQRTALTIDKEPVEYRRSHYHLAVVPGLTYATIIR